MQDEAAKEENQYHYAFRLDSDSIAVLVVAAPAIPVQVMDVDRYRLYQLNVEG
jgi:hypothetical protein